MSDQHADNHVWVNGEKCDCCDGTHPYHQEWCYTTETWVVNESIHRIALDRIHGMERREVTFRSEIERRDDFIRRLMVELSKYGWNYNEKRPEVHALLQEGKIYENAFVIMQEGNVYERGSDQNGESPEEAGT